MADTGWLSPTQGAEIELIGATIGWNSTEGNIVSANDTPAYAESTLSTGESSHWLVASAFGASIPVGAAIDGVIVEILTRSGHYSNAVSATLTGIKLFDGNPIGSELSDYYTWDTGATFAYRAYGGATNLWGASLNRSLVVSNVFGVGINVLIYGDDFTPTDFACDYIRMKIFYTAAAGGAGNFFQMF